MTVSAVAVLLGILVVVQLRTQSPSAALSGLSAQDLTVLVGNLNAHNEQLRGEVAQLDQQLANLSRTQSSGEGSVDDIRRDLARIRAWTGLEAVAGSGVTVTVSGAIAGQGVQDIVNELHNAGAEAIAIEDVRVVPGTVVAGPAGGLSVENTPLADPFEILALGSPEALTGSLTRNGGLIAQLSATYPRALLTVTPVDRLDLPATRRTLVPVYGRPRL
ncbi:MAG TPA: DUF881 domain-containing protein [Candidatus Limnocylindrales bacterium]|nr:DUF881 domain-containing protein [Candidatus Limnocylindrales bacterium]